MDSDREQTIAALVETMPQLTNGQLHWIQRVVSVYAADSDFVLKSSELFDESTLRNFGDAMRVHHSFSAEAFSKDKFEYVLVSVLKMSGIEAELAPKGNPGHDATVNGVKLSLKTQADKNIKDDMLWISKFMELGKGDWGDDPSDLEGLREQFINHMQGYERIFSLRNLARGPSWKYELVEIPKDVLCMAEQGELEMKLGSKQFPKPGYCYVRDPNGSLVFSLYFDGGGERKLQIKNLDKNRCDVHATWSFEIPTQ